MGSEQGLSLLIFFPRVVTQHERGLFLHDGARSIHRNRPNKLARSSSVSQRPI